MRAKGSVHSGDATHRNALAGDYTEDLSGLKFQGYKLELLGFYFVSRLRSRLVHSVLRRFRLTRFAVQSPADGDDSASRKTQRATAERTSKPAANGAPSPRERVN